MPDLKVLLLDENRGFGGAEKHVVALAGQLHPRGALATVVGRKDSWLRGACADANLPFHECGFRNEVDMFSVFALWKLIKNSEAQIVHCIAHRDLVAAALALQLPGTRPGVTLLKAEHSFPDPNLSPLFRRAYRSCAVIASVSQSLQNEIRAALKDDPGLKAQFRVIPNGIEVGPEPATRPLGTPPRLGVLSALREGKGHADFLQGVARWQAQTGQSVQLSIAGEGPLRERLQALAADLALECEFLGHCEDPVSYLQTLDLCVLPSHVETFSLVALEALVCGTPLLAADSAGVCELYPEESMLYPKGDFIALSEALERILQAPEQAQARALELAPSYRTQYCQETMANNYLALYHELVAQTTS